MKILMVSPYFYPEGGGLERYAYQMAKGLSRNNDVTVVCMTKKYTKIEKIGEIKVYRLKPLFILSNTPISPLFPFRLARIMKKEKFDLIIAHTPVPYAADVASLLAKIFGTRLKIVYHTVGLEKGRAILDMMGRIYSHTLERLTLRNCEIISVSEKVWEYLKSRGFSSSITIPGIGEGLRGIRGTKRENAILFVGQLGKYHRFKNLDMLIEVFAQISREFPDWRLWIVGDGDLREYYEALITKLEIKGKVEFFGYVKNPEDLAEIYSRAKILVLPSSFESFGMVVLEALYFKTPVVVNKNVGATDRLVFSGKNGFIFNTKPELYTILKKLLSNPKIIRKMTSHGSCLKRSIRKTYILFSHNMYWPLTRPASEGLKNEVKWYEEG